MAEQFKLNLTPKRGSIEERLAAAKVGRLSATKISIYKRCNFKYALTYVFRVKVPTPIHFVFGQEIHHVVELSFKQNFESGESLAKRFAHQFMCIVAGKFLEGKEKENLVVTKYPNPSYNPEKPESKPEIEIGNHIRIWGRHPEYQVLGYLGHGMKILRDFFEDNMHLAPPLETELRIEDFDYQYTPHSKKYPYRAIIDRVDELREGGKSLTDYKTDKTLPLQKNIDEGHQLTGYHKAFQHFFNGEEPKKLIYKHLPTRQLIETFREDKQFKELDELCAEVTEGIEKRQFFPSNLWGCGPCEFKPDGVCENYLKKYEKAIGKKILAVGIPAWSGLLNEKPPEVEKKKKKPSKRKFKGETESQYALFP